MKNIEIRYRKMIEKILIEFEEMLTKGDTTLSQIRKLVLNKMIDEYLSISKETGSYNHLRDIFIIKKLYELNKAKKYIEIKREYEYLTDEDKEAIERIHKFFKTKQDRAIKLTLRKIRDFFDRPQREATHTLNKLVRKKTFNTIDGIKNRTKAIEEITKELAETLKVPLVNKNNKVIKMELAAYSKLNLNTAIQNVNNTAAINTGKQLGNHLVVFSSHHWTCEVCAKYAEGRVYSTDPKDQSWPYLYDLPGFKEGYNNLHPNCKHRLSGYYLIAHSKKEVEIKRKLSYNRNDIRSEQNITKYNDAQKKAKEQRIKRLKKLISMIKKESKQ